MTPDEHQIAFETLKTSLQINQEARLTLKGQEMVLLPRHFFRYILREVRERAGSNAFDEIFHKSGFDGAVTFCTRYREENNCTPAQAVEAYLAEMSVRGWGRFTIESFSPADGILNVVLTGSALVSEGDLPSGHPAWKGAMEGAVRTLPNISERTALAASIEETADGCKISVCPQQQRG